MKAIFSRGDKTEKSDVDGKVPRSSGDAGSGRNAEMVFEKMYFPEYGYCDMIKRGKALRGISPTTVRPGAFSWTEY